MKEKVARIRRKAHSYAGYIAFGLAVLLFLSVIRASIFSDMPEDKKIWFEVSFLLLVAVSAEFLVVYVRQPTVMVLLLLGVLISPGTVGLVSPYVSEAIKSAGAALGMDIPVSDTIPHLVPAEGFISIFAKLGAIFLLFKVGLHSEVQRIFNKKNFLVALVGVIFPFVGGYLYATGSGHPFGYAMFLGAALTATSVGITVAVLQEFGVLEREFARVILGAAVIDDILGLLVLSLVQNLSGGLDAASMTPLLWTLFLALVYVIGGIKMGQYIVSRYFDRCCLENGKIGNATFLGILVYVLSYAYVAEYVGLSAIVGAFLAGVTLNYSRIIGKVVESVYPLEAFFTPIFFISLGIFVDIKALAMNLEPVLIVTAIAILTKIIGCGLASLATGAGRKDAAIIGIGMIPRGEVALIIGLYGLSATTRTGEAILGPAEYSIIASMAFLTTVIIPPMLQKALEYGGYRAKG